MSSRTDEAESTYLLPGPDLGNSEMVIPRDLSGDVTRFRPFSARDHKAWSIKAVAGADLDLTTLVIEEGETYTIPENTTVFYTDIENNGDLELNGDIQLTDDTTPDADIDVEAYVSTSDDREFTEFASGGGTATAIATSEPPEKVAMIFSNEAAIDSLNASVTPASEATAGVYEIVFTSHSTR